MWPTLGVGVSGEGVALVLLIACLATGACAPGSSDTARSPDTVISRDRVQNVFTDTALYRATCLEADSGFGPGSGRCTPRYQGPDPDLRE